MGRFIIHSKSYRDHYQRFVIYLQTVGYALASRRTYAPALREFFWWLEKQKIMSLDQVQEQDIENFYSYQQQRPNTTKGGTLSESRIAVHMYVLKLLFGYLQDTDQLTMNPMNNLDYGRTFARTRENLLSLQDVQKLYDACKTARQRAILGILYGCGLRRQEAVRLNARDVHFKSELLYVRQGKGGRKRIVPLSKTVLADLKEYYYQERPRLLDYNNPDGLQAFMLNTRGARMQGFTWRDEIKKLIVIAALNKQITLHHFRHAIATHLLESGMKTEQVKDFLGHKSIVTTQTYTHITITQMKKTTSYGTEKIPG